MFFGVSLTIVLVLMWVALSGDMTLSGSHPLIIWLGAISVIIAMALTVRMRILDRETAPFGPAPRLLAYWSWLGQEIVAANIAVLRLIMRPDIDISPRLVRVPVDLESDLARCTFANSITLTPGTVTVDVQDDGFLVHALDASFTDPRGFAEMGERTGEAADNVKTASSETKAVQGGEGEG